MENNTPLKVEEGLTEFDLQVEDVRLRAAERPLAILIFGGLALLLTVGLALVVLGYLGHELVVLVLGLLPLGLGLIFVRPALRASNVRYDRIAISATGLILTGTDGRRWFSEWQNPGFRIVLMDYRSSTHWGPRRFREIPCELICPQFEVGLSVRAFDAIRQEAGRVSLQIVEQDIKGTRALIIGSGQQFAAPFRLLPGS